MSLVMLNAPVPSFLNAMRRFEGRAIIYDPRLFVMTPALIRFTPWATSELLAFQFARFIGMPTPKFTGFICPDPLFTRKGWSKPGRIGLALEWTGVPVITGGWCNRARRQPNTIAKALVLSVMREAYDVRMALTRHRQLVAFDMGGLFPIFDSDWAHDRPDPLEQGDLCEASVGVYLRSTERMLSRVTSDVQKYNLENRFHRIIERVLESPWGALEECFDLRPHPMADQIREAAASVVREQLESAYELV